ncbi:MAG: NUDIX domain-containing protein [bacterium]|nr:NUDIX domain-containing protein [bacterium]
MTSQKPFSAETFREIYSQVPRLCVELVIKSPEGIVLTLRSLPTWNNKWHLPGSTMRYGEDVEAAAHRTAADEIGISVTIEKMLGYIEYPSEKQERGFGRSVGLVFLCSTPSAVFKEPDEEASLIKAFPELPGGLIEEQKIFLESRSDWIRNSSTQRSKK